MLEIFCFGLHVRNSDFPSRLEFLKGECTSHQFLEYMRIIFGKIDAINFLKIYIATTFRILYSTKIFQKLMSKKEREQLSSSSIHSSRAGTFESPYPISTFRMKNTKRRFR